MRVLILEALIMMAIAGNVKAECSIILWKTSATSKTAYTKDGDSISESVRDKLASQCKFNLKLMSVEQKRKFDINRLEKRLKKIKGTL